MNTEISIKGFADIPLVDLKNSIEEALNQFYVIVARFTRFNDSSELSILNKSDGKFVCVAPDLFELVKYGVDLGNKTKGIFDITIIDILEAYGYDKEYNFSKLDDVLLKQKITNLVKIRPKFSEIEFNKNNYKIKLQKKQRIDMGAYAKGYAIRLAKNWLLKSGVDNFFLNAGGDVYAHGYDYTKTNKKSWEAALFDPEKSLKTGKFETFKTIKIKDEAIACSGPWARKVKFFHHLINPITGLPASNNESVVFVKNKDPMNADALATIKYLTNEESSILLDAKI
ncbi:FAD:protein FMN transferase [Candidatus Dojkabacteria bacterium]|nr:FAD:protein FMN transferase [Candidatus Dojkabacteria bacterium]